MTESGKRTTSMPRILLVPDLPLDHSPAMDKYAHRLHDWLESGEPGLEVRLAAHIGELTRETRDGRSSGGVIPWGAQPGGPARAGPPGPLPGAHRYLARYF